MLPALPACCGVIGAAAAAGRVLQQLSGLFPVGLGLVGSSCLLIKLCMPQVVAHGFCLYTNFPTCCCLLGLAPLTPPGLLQLRCCFVSRSCAYRGLVTLTRSQDNHSCLRCTASCGGCAVRVVALPYCAGVRCQLLKLGVQECTRRVGAAPAVAAAAVPEDCRGQPT